MSGCLCFRLASASYALPLAAVSGIGEVGTIRPVPGAPARVLGIAALRGGVVTVLDLPAIVGDGPGEGGDCLVRLAEPHPQAALWVPARVEVAPGPPAGARVLDPDRLLADARR